MKYFTLKELARSDIATRLGIDNTPTEEAVRNLHWLVDHVLDPLREKYGQPIYVNSGYRCPALNTLVGGAKGSQHMRGCAADITAAPRRGSARADNKLLADILQESIPFDQLILYDENAQGPQFLHVSIALPGKEYRHQVLHK